MTTPYDELTLELERVETLARFLEEQLSDMAEPDQDGYALSLIAGHIADRCKTHVLKRVQELLASTTTSRKGGAQ